MSQAAEVQVSGVVDDRRHEALLGPRGDTQVLGVATWSLAASITAFSFG